MPDPVEPPRPEPLWVEAVIEISLRVKVDVTGLVRWRRDKDNHYVTDAGPLDYDDITGEYLAQHGYGLDERGSVFIHNNIIDTIDVSVWHGGESSNGDRLIEELPFGDTDVRFTWNDRLQEQLDERLT